MLPYVAWLLLEYYLDFGPPIIIPEFPDLLDLVNIAANG